MLKALHRARFVTATVLPHTNKAVHNCKNASNDRSDYYDDEARDIARCVFRLENQWPNEITYCSC